jgi:hypothetical protein
MSGDAHQTRGERGRRVIGDSAEFKRIRRAVDKAHGEREQALKNICRLYGVKSADRLPASVRAAAIAMADNR